MPIVPGPDLGTGRFRIVCSRDLEDIRLEETEAVGTPVEVSSPEPVPGPARPGE